MDLRSTYGQNDFTLVDIYLYNRVKQMMLEYLIGQFFDDLVVFYFVVTNY